MGIITIFCVTILSIVSIPINIMRSDAKSEAIPTTPAFLVDSKSGMVSKVSFLKSRRSEDGTNADISGSIYGAFLDLKNNDSKNNKDYATIKPTTKTRTTNSDSVLSPEYVYYNIDSDARLAEIEKWCLKYDFDTQSAYRQG